MPNPEAKFTPGVPAAGPDLDSIVLKSGSPPPPKWHEHTEARVLIARSPIENLPGLDDATRMRIVRADRAREPKSTSGKRYGAWPQDVRHYCTIVWGDLTGESILMEWKGIGEGTISAIRESLEALGIRPGMKYGAFDAWEHCLKHDPSIRV